MKRKVTTAKRPTKRKPATSRGHAAAEAMIYRAITRPPRVNPALVAAFREHRDWLQGT